MPRLIFELPVNEAARLAQKRGSEIAGGFKKPLHEVPMADLRRAVAKRLESLQHEASTTGPLYSHYEIGNSLLIRRLLSRMAHDGALEPAHAGILKTALGEIYYGAPALVFRRQLGALSALEKRLGSEKAEELLQKARKAWLAQNEELASARIAQSREKIGDTLLNPTQNMVLFFAPFLQKQIFERDGLLEAAKENLREWIGKKPQSYYKSWERKKK
ncbi:MAG: hypothetical protein WC792_06200 [Candidatus Micrarchaeia archaeon]